MVNNRCPHCPGVLLPDPHRAGASATMLRCVICGWARPVALSALVWPVKVLILGALLSLSGCSATEAIRDAATKVGQQSAVVADNVSGAKEDIGKALGTGDVGPKAKPHLENAIPKLDKAAAANTEIHKAANTINDNVEHVKDTNPLWWIPWVLVMAPVIFLVWRFWPFIQVFIGWIPGVFRQRAKVAAEFEADPAPIDPNDEATIKRIEKEKADPRFAAAFDQELLAKGKLS